MNHPLYAPMFNPRVPPAPGTTVDWRLSPSAPLFYRSSSQLVLDITGTVLTLSFADVKLLKVRVGANPPGIFTRDVLVDGILWRLALTYAYACGGSSPLSLVLDTEAGDDDGDATARANDQQLATRFHDFQHHIRSTHSRIMVIGLKVANPHIFACLFKEAVCAVLYKRHAALQTVLTFLRLLIHLAPLAAHDLQIFVLLVSRLQKPWAQGATQSIYPVFVLPEAARHLAGENTPPGVKKSMTRSVFGHALEDLLNVPLMVLRFANAPQQTAAPSMEDVGDTRGVQSMVENLRRNIASHGMSGVVLNVEQGELAITAAPSLGKGLSKKAKKRARRQLKRYNQHQLLLSQLSSVVAEGDQKQTCSPSWKHHAPDGCALSDDQLQWAAKLVVGLGWGAISDPEELLVRLNQTNIALRELVRRLAVLCSGKKRREERAVAAQFPPLFAQEEAGIMSLLIGANFQLANPLVVGKMQAVVAARLGGPRRPMEEMLRAVVDRARSDSKDMARMLVDTVVCSLQTGLVPHWLLGSKPGFIRTSVTSGTRPDRELSPALLRQRDLESRVVIRLPAADLACPLLLEPDQYSLTRRCQLGLPAPMPRSWVVGRTHLESAQAKVVRLGEQDSHTEPLRVIRLNGDRGIMASVVINGLVLRDGCTWSRLVDVRKVVLPHAPVPFPEAKQDREPFPWDTAGWQRHKWADVILRPLLERSKSVAMDSSVPSVGCWTLEDTKTLRKNHQHMRSRIRKPLADWVGLLASLLVGDARVCAIWIDVLIQLAGWCYMPDVVRRIGRNCRFLGPGRGLALSVDLSRLALLHPSRAIQGAMERTARWHAQRQQLDHGDWDEPVPRQQQQLRGRPLPAAMTRLPHPLDAGFAVSDGEWVDGCVEHKPLARAAEADGVPDQDARRVGIEMASLLCRPPSAQVCLPHPLLPPKLASCADCGLLRKPCAQDPTPTLAKEDQDTVALAPTAESILCSILCGTGQWVVPPGATTVVLKTVRRQLLQRMEAVGQTQTGEELDPVWRALRVAVQLVEQHLQQRWDADQADKALLAMRDRHMDQQSQRMKRHKDELTRLEEQFDDIKHQIMVRLERAEARLASKTVQHAEELRRLEKHHTADKEAQLAKFRRERAEHQRAVRNSAQKLTVQTERTREQQAARVALEERVTEVQAISAALAKVLTTRDETIVKLKAERALQQQQLDKMRLASRAFAASQQPSPDKIKAQVQAAVAACEAKHERKQRHLSDQLQSLRNNPHRLLAALQPLVNEDKVTSHHLTDWAPESKCLLSGLISASLQQGLRGRSCCICLEKPRDTLMGPSEAGPGCKHLCMCQECATEVFCCPICRAKGAPLTVHH